ncbi:MAG: roadblock/LC7 domain-containing protein [Chloroflexia bacterium]|nr:roadblock/LC7 domain-containing protein [Chloroflexia bacterium]
MSSHLQNLLNSFRTLSSVELAAVVAPDGLLIESLAEAEHDVDAICAVASNSLVLAEALGREIAKGEPRQMVLEYGEGLVIIEPMSSDALLLIMTNSRDDLGYLRFLVAKHRVAMLEALSAI